MSGITSSGNNLAAELVLNKLMNGQAEAESGRTVNAASRQAAAALNSEAEALVAINPGIKTATAELTELQSLASEFRLALIDVNEAVTSGNATAISTAAEVADQVYASINANPYAAATTIDAGLGATISHAILPADIKTLGDSLAGLVTTPATTDTFTGAYADGLTGVINLESSLGLEIGLLENRTALIDDVVNTYTTTASNQYVQSVDGATDLLRNVIG